jgi:hypothetical protein
MAGPFTTGMAGPAAVDQLNALWSRIAGVHALVDGAAIDFNISSIERVFSVTLGGNRTLNPTGRDATGNTVALGHADLAALDGKLIMLRVRQDATGGRLLTLTGGAGGFRFGSLLSSVTLSIAPNATDLIGTVYDHANAVLDVASFSPGY